MIPEVSWMGRPVTHPVLRALVMAYASVLLSVVWCGLVVTAPVWLLLDPVLKRFGRRGFIQARDSGVTVVWGPDAFRRLVCLFGFEVIPEVRRAEMSDEMVSVAEPKETG